MFLKAFSGQYCERNESSTRLLQHENLDTFVGLRTVRSMNLTRGSLSRQRFVRPALQCKIRQEFSITHIHWEHVQ